MNGFEHFGVRVRSKGELSTRPCRAASQMHQRLTLEIRPLQPSQPVRSAQTTARGRRIAGACGAMPGDASESAGQQRVSYRKAERRILGAALWLETRTPPERLGRMHDDLLASNKETRPLLDCAGTCGNCGARGNGETTQWTLRLDSAGGIPTGAYEKWSTTPGTEGNPPDTERLLVCKITTESHALDFSVPNRKCVDYGSRRIRNLTCRIESVGLEKYVDTYVPYRMARHTKLPRKRATDTA